MATINKQSCPTCGQSVNEREISLFNGMVEALWNVVLWCVENKTYKFTRKDIKHLLKGDNQVARFGDWVFFGGLVFKEGRGNYGVNKERIKAFYNNSLEIPIRISKNPITNDITVLARGTILDVPKIGDFLDNKKEFSPIYRGDFRIRNVE